MADSATEATTAGRSASAWDGIIKDEKLLSMLRDVESDEDDLHGLEAAGRAGALSASVAISDSSEESGDDVMSAAILRGGCAAVVCPNLKAYMLKKEKEDPSIDEIYEDNQYLYIYTYTDRSTVSFSP